MKQQILDISSEIQNIQILKLFKQQLRIAEFNNDPFLEELKVEYEVLELSFLEEKNLAEIVYC